MQCYQCGTLKPGRLYNHPTDKHDIGKYCRTCYSGLKSPRVVVGANGSECKQTTGMCACCGFSCGFEGSGDGWFLWRAGWADADGVFMARLCGDEYGAGCVYEVKPMRGERAEAVEVITDLLGDDLDGAQALCEDFGLCEF